MLFPSDWPEDERVGCRPRPLSCQYPYPCAVYLRVGSLTALLYSFCLCSWNAVRSWRGDTLGVWSWLLPTKIISVCLSFCHIGWVPSIYWGSATPGSCLCLHMVQPPSQEKEVLQKAWEKDDQRRRKSRQRWAARGEGRGGTDVTQHVRYIMDHFIASLHRYYLSRWNRSGPVVCWPS